MTANSVRTDGLKAANEIRLMGTTAEETGRELAKYAEEVASAIIEASERVAKSIEAYLEHCEITKKMMATQLETLADLPERAIDREEPPKELQEQSMAAVEKALALHRGFGNERSVAGGVWNGTDWVSQPGGGNGR